MDQNGAGKSAPLWLSVTDESGKVPIRELGFVAFEISVVFLIDNLCGVDPRMRGE